MVEILPLSSGSSGNCYRLSDGSTPILLECGISFREIKKKLKFKTSEIAACLISHEHGDHAKAVKDVLKAGIDCYMSEGTRTALGVSGHRVHVIQAKKQFQVGTWIIVPFETKHDAEEPLGFLLYSLATGAKVLFATDTRYIHNQFGSGLTHIMVEANYAIDIIDKNVANGIVPKSLRDRILYSHFELQSVKDFLKANDLSKVEEIWLLHLSDDNSDAERFKKEIEELTGKPVYIA